MLCRCGRATAAFAAALVAAVASVFGIGLLAACSPQSPAEGAAASGGTANAASAAGTASNPSTTLASTATASGVAESVETASSRAAKSESPTADPLRPPGAAQARVAVHLPLPPPGRVRDWNELRRQAAHRLVAANPDGTYLGPVPEPLLAIPVLTVDLKQDGSIARIVVLRAPHSARDTIALASAALHRAAPFGEVSHLPKPWRFTETFLFAENRKFKPRTLDE